MKFLAQLKLCNQKRLIHLLLGLPFPLNLQFLNQLDE